MPRTILIVDDELMNRSILINILSKEYNILTAESGEEALSVMGEMHTLISAVLLDLKMPGMDGFEVLTKIKESKEFRSIPVIVVTALTDDGSEEKAVSLGAYGFVTKPYKSVLLKRHLNNAISFRESAALQNIIRRDSLTGIPNSKGFTEQAEALIKGQPPGYYVLSCFDIDSFKIINDQYGTKCGDLVLKHTANAINDCVTGIGGICCRISSDNFAALYPVKYLGSDIIKEAYERAVSPDCITRRINMRVGRLIVDDTSLSITSMYDRATLAKESIRNRYDVYEAVFDESMRNRLIHEQVIVSEMGGALDNGQFRIWLQPQYNHATGAMIGAEALVRWEHPERGLIGPYEFIPVFERNGFIYSLDKYIWEQVCIYLHKWIEEGRSPLPVSVNISRQDISAGDIVGVLSELVEKYDIPVSLLRLEITESAFSESPDQVAYVVKQLIERGFTVEIDDFGSGYSSLNTLKDVPAQILKLDMRFLEKSTDSQRGGNIIESIVRMAKWLGMSVIAEGVETLSQADFLRSIGCNYIQGYLYAKPMPVEKYEEHCRKIKKEERLLALETVENLDNNLFWDPDSMDTLIFNSYVGGACIYEYYDGTIELTRATEKYGQVVSSAGMTVEDALKINWAEHMTEESRRRVRADLQRSIADKSEITGEYVFLDLPGCPHETHLRSTMRVIAAAGRRYMVYCTNENITAQRESEERERLVAQQMAAIMKNIDGGVAAMVFGNESLRILFANDRYYQQLGYSREEYGTQASGILGCILEDDLPTVLNKAESINASGKTECIEFRIRRADGEIRWIRSNISLMEYPGEEASVQLSVSIDITEQRNAELKAKHLSEQIASMMDDMPGGFVRMEVFDDGSIKPIYLNEGFERLTGMNHDKLMDLYAEDALAGVHPDDIDIVKDVVAEMLENGEAYSSRYRLLNNNGQYMWLSIFGRVTRESSGKIYMNIYYTDASEQVKEEEIQKAMMDNLPGGTGLFLYEKGSLSIAYLNDSYQRMIGKKIKDCRTVPALTGVHPDDKKIIHQELISAIREKRDMVCNFRLERETEGYRSVHLMGHIVPQGDENYHVYTMFEPLNDKNISYQQTLPLLLSAMMESTTDLTFAKDKEFRYLCASRAFVNMAGQKDINDVVGKTDYDIFSKELADKFRADDEALMASGQSIVDIIEAIPSNDGTPHYSETSKFLIKDGVGQIIGLFGIGRDVTKTVVQDSQLKLVNDSIPGGLATFVCVPGDLNFENVRVTYFNDGYCRLLGMTRNEYLEYATTGLASVVFSEDRHILVEHWRTLMNGIEHSECFYRAHTREGGYKWISHRAAVADRTSESVVINAMLQDVTEQREIIELLRIAQEENNLALSHGGSVVTRFNVAERSLTVAKSVASSFDIPEVIFDVPDGPIKQGMISPESADAYKGFFEAIINGSKVGSVLYQQRYFGTMRWMEAKSTTIFTDDGKPVKAVISMFDVTDQMEKENVYKKWQHSLEDRAPESYTLFRCNINNNCSYDTKEGTLISFDFDKAGRDFNERARSYVNQCVHNDDKDNYITFINADTMLANYYRGKRSDTLDYREILRGGAYRWVRLSADLVEYPNSTDVEAYLMYENIDASKRAQLETKELSETDPLTGLLNRNTFIINVEKILHSAKQGSRHALMMLDVDCFKQVNDVFGHGAGDQVLLDIAKGLKSAVRKDDLVGRLGGDEFVVFLENITDEGAVVTKAKQIRTLIRRYFSMEVQISASIGISFAPRDGMDFETLYKKADAALYHVKGSGRDNQVVYSDEMKDEHLKPEPDIISFSGEKTAEKKRRMLIVDDSSIDYALLQNIFYKEFIIEKAGDGNAALIRLRHYGSAISVVLLDLRMPGMDGFEVLAKMQETPELRSIPVIIVSGDESRNTCLAAIRRGATDFITKPVDAGLLRIRVHSAVSKAENERLRAKNSMLELQNSERISYESALQSTGVTFIEYSLLTGEFSYYPSVSKYLYGTYDNRNLWEILLSDGVADEQSVQNMQRLEKQITEDREKITGSMKAMLKTPEGHMHNFRITVRKIHNEQRFTNKLIISLDDLDYEAEDEC